MLRDDGPVDEDGLELEPDDVDEVLASLRALMAKASSPVVRTCLEEAHDAIAHLAGKAGMSEGAEDRDEAA